MTYKIKVTDKRDRKARIDQLANGSNSTSKFLFEGKDQQLPIVRIQLDLPVYRTSNGRTTVAQRRYISEHGKSDNFFTQEENVSAQQAQHKILFELSQDSKANIFRELETVRKQSEDLLITRDGVVVNGNRRLAAMRELYNEDSATYREFGYIDALLLPANASMEQIETIEIELQMVPETKLEYGWVERRLKIRKQVNELNIPLEKVRAAYRFKKEEDLNKELTQLDLVDEYLEKYIKRPGEYWRVEQSGQIFTDLQKAIAAEPDLKEIKFTLACPLIKESQNLSDRVYAFNPAFGKYATTVAETLAVDAGIPIDTEKGKTLPLKYVWGDDPLNGLEAEPPAYWRQLRDVLIDEKKSNDLAVRIANISDELRQRAKDGQAKSAALDAVKQAAQLLTQIDLTTSEPAKFSEIDSKLSLISDQVLKLKEQLKKLSNKLGTQTE